jgi:hypothetical protein
MPVARCALFHGPLVYAMLVVGQIICFSSTSTAAANDATSIGELEERILTSRRAIRSGEFQIESVSEGPRPRAPVRYHTWIAPGGRVRQECTMKEGLHVSLLNEEFAYHYFRRPGEMENPDRTRRPVIRRVPVAEARRDQHPFAVCDPLTLMLVPAQFGLAPHYGLETLINAPGRTNLQLRPTEWNGRPAVTVSFDGPRAGNSYEYDVVPSTGHNVVRWRLRRTDRPAGKDPVELDIRTTCELGEIAESVWFPQKVHWVRNINGKLDSGEVLTIKVASVNSAIPETALSLAGGDLPPDVVVVPRVAGVKGKEGPTTRPGGSNGLSVWDGEKVRPFSRADAVAMQLSKAPKQAGKVSHWKRLWIAGALAAVACAVLAYGFWRRRQAKHLAA